MNIGLQGAKVVRELISETQSLTHLVLSGNNMLGVRGVEQICEGLRVNASLARLALANVGCGTPGAETLLEVMDANRTLTEVRLSPTGRASERCAVVCARAALCVLVGVLCGVGAFRRPLG